MTFMIDGSRFKAALEAGKNGECSTVYRKCPFDQNSIYTFLRQISNKTWMFIYVWQKIKEKEKIRNYYVLLYDTSFDKYFISF